MEAVVLAGGFGTRLRSVVSDVPKPMAPVAGRPFLELLLGSLERKGLQRAVLAVGHLAQVVVQHFGTRFRGVELCYEIEDTPLGTGGAIMRAFRQCRADTALVVNGDTYLDLDLTQVTRHWQRHRTPAIVALQVPDTARYGRLLIAADGQCTGFAEKCATGPGAINTGHYYWPTSLLDGHGLPDAFSIESDFLAEALQSQRFDALMTSGRFIDIGIPEDYARAQTELADLAM